MLHQIIDRRLAGKNKSIANRERFLRRSIKEIENSKSITIPRKDISEPVFRHGPGGRREMVHPGNEDYVRGDKIPRPEGGGSGSGRGAASKDGEGEDDFVFELTREEFMQYFFEDLELPRLIRTHLMVVPNWKHVRACGPQILDQEPCATSEYSWCSPPSKDLALTSSPLPRRCRDS